MRPIRRQVTALPSVVGAGLASGDISASEADHPVVWRPGCPHRPTIRGLNRRAAFPSTSGGSRRDTEKRLRLQTPLPERYIDTDDTNVARIAEAEVKDATFLLWRGHCSVHQRFRPEHVADLRQRHPDGVVVVHPQCTQETVRLADRVGSTNFIIRDVEAAESGTAVGIGTEVQLLNRLPTENPDKAIESRDPLVCPCSTMFRIDAAHLAWILEGLFEGKVRNRISVDSDTRAWAHVAPDRMLAIT